MKFAVFSKRDEGLYVQATAWHESRADAELDAEINTDLGMEGQPVGRMGVLLDGHVYVEHRYAHGVCDGEASVCVSASEGSADVPWDTLPEGVRAAVQRGIASLRRK